MSVDRKQEWDLLLDRPEAEIDLGRGALLLARNEYPDINLEAQISRLDGLAARAAPGVDAQREPLARLDALCRFLAEECGFHGDEQDYHDPRNSFLNQVLDRRTGIPISLSVVYMEVGRRLGLPLYGVGLPGHFLVKYLHIGQRIYLDPFHGGRKVSAAQCREMVERIYNGQMEFREDFLAAVTKRKILLRMLNNLRGIYLGQQQFRKALQVLETILAISPASAPDLKQRGMLHWRLHHYRQARRDLEKCLSLDPRAADAAEVEKSLTELKRASALLN